jgi:hypothetical protein
MAFEPTADHGQKLATRERMVSGFLDDKVESESFAESVRGVGYPTSKIISLDGPDGLQSIEVL